MSSLDDDCIYLGKWLYLCRENIAVRSPDAHPLDVNARSKCRGLFAKEIIERGLRLLQFAGVLRDESAGFRAKVIAEIRLVLLPNFLGRGFLAVLRVAHVILDAHFANVEFGIAGFTDIEAAQRQA
jgi:hypothetical protein